MKNLAPQFTNHKVFILETLETMYDISVSLFLVKGTEEIKLCYRTGNEGGYIETKYTLKTTAILNKKEVFELVKEYFSSSIRWHGLPRFYATGYLNQKDLNDIISALEIKIREFKDEGKKTANHFTEYLDSQSLNPNPTGDHKHSWQAYCPFSGNSHYMMISTENNTYGCGWCRKKGNQIDLEDYFKIKP